MDGRFDQHFIELFATRRTPDSSNGSAPPLWPIAIACLIGIVVFAGMANLA
jgi:hypothetical protein